MLKSINKLFPTNPRKVFNQFRLGTSCFFTGLVMVYIAENSLGDSLEKEIAVLLALLLVGFGFLLALSSHLRLLLFRIKSFFRS